MSKHPAGWEKFSLQELSSLVTSGGTPTSGDSRYYVGSGGYPFAKTEDLSASGSKYLNDCELKITDIGLRNSSAKVYPISTILISMYGTIGLPKITGVELAANQALCALLPPFKCDVNFLYHALVHIRKEWIKDSGQTTQANINGSAVKEKKILMPPRAEQKTIANILDTLDTQIRQTEAIIAKLQQVKQGLLHDLLTRGIDENGQLRPPHEQAPELYKESPLGWIPKEWEVGSLSDLCSALVDCPHTTPDYRDEGVYVARTMHIKNGEFLQERASRVSEEGYISRIGRLKPMPGDVIFTREAPVGEAFVIPEGMRICLGQRVMVVRPKKDSLFSGFLLQQIYSGQIQKRMKLLTAGTTNPHLNVADVRKMLIPVPPLAEQKEVVRLLDGQKLRERSESEKIEKLKKQKSGLMDDLLTGRVRVTDLIEQQQQAS